MSQDNTSNTYVDENNWNETMTFQFEGNDVQALTQTLTSAVNNLLNNMNPPTTTTTNNASPNNSTNENQGANEFDCSICKELLCEPLILMCQHSFCFDCIQRHNNKKKNINNPLNPQQQDLYQDYPPRINDSSLCPICRFPFTIPPRYNQEFENLLAYQFPDEYKERKETLNVNKQQNELEDKMRKEVWNMINKNPPIEDKYGAPIFRPYHLNNIQCPQPVELEELHPQQKGFFGKVSSFLSSALSSNTAQVILTMSITIPLAMFISKKLNLLTN